MKYFNLERVLQVIIRISFGIVEEEVRRKVFAGLDCPVNSGLV